MNGLFDFLNRFLAISAFIILTVVIVSGMYFFGYFS